MLCVYQGALTWRHVSHHSQSWSFNSLPLQPQSMMVAVSAELLSPLLGLISTGMQWSRCVYDINARL